MGIAVVLILRTIKKILDSTLLGGKTLGCSDFGKTLIILGNTSIVRDKFNVPNYFHIFLKLRFKYTLI